MIFTLLTTDSIFSFSGKFPQQKEGLLKNVQNNMASNDKLASYGVFPVSPAQVCATTAAAEKYPHKYLLSSLSDGTVA